jgi:hypothetical protein
LKILIIITLFLLKINSFLIHSIQKKNIKKYNKKENIVFTNSFYLQKIIENSDDNYFISIKNQSISNSSHLKTILKFQLKIILFLLLKFILKILNLLTFIMIFFIELDIKSNIYPFYEISNKNIKNSIDLF